MLSLKISCLILMWTAIAAKTKKQQSNLTQGSSQEQILLPTQGPPPTQEPWPTQAHQPTQGSQPEKEFQPTQGPPSVHGPTQGLPSVQGPTQGPPSVQGPTQGPPSIKGPTQGPPSIKEPTQGPPSLQGPKQGPPSIKGPTQGPPSLKGPTQGPPFVQGPTQGPPSVQGPTQGPPSVQGPTQGPPSIKGPTQGPPSVQGPTQGPPSIKGPTQGPPSIKGPTQGPPSIKGPTQGPPSIKGRTQGPPSIKGPTQGPPSIKGPTQGPPSIKGPTQRPPSLQGPTQGPPSIKGPTQGPPSIKRPTQGPPSFKGPTQGPPFVQGLTQGPPSIKGPTQGPHSVQGPTQGPPSVQEPTQGPPFIKGPTQGLPYVQGPTQGPPSLQGPTQGPPSVQGPTQGPPYVQGPTQGPPYVQGPTQGSPYVQGPTQGPPYVQGPTQEPPSIQQPTQEPPSIQQPTQGPPPIQGPIDPYQPNLCKRRVCAFYYKEKKSKFEPENIDPSLCSHILYLKVEVKGNNLVPTTQEYEADYRKVIDLKRSYPHLKILLSVVINECQKEPFVTLASSQSSIQRFTTTVITYLRKYGFDGLVTGCLFLGKSRTRPKAKLALTNYIKGMREAINNEASGADRLELVLRSLGEKIVDDNSYDVRALSDSVDWISLNAVYLQGPWNGVTGHHSPLYPNYLVPLKGAGVLPPEGRNPQFSVDTSVKYWITKGAPADKIVIELPPYGLAFTLTGSQRGLGAPATRGRPGTVIGRSDVISYREICGILQEHETMRIFLNNQKVPFLIYQDQWIGYDDPVSLSLKVQYIKSQGLGGFIFEYLDWDDYNDDSCGQGPYPLLKAIDTACLK